MFSNLIKVTIGIIIGLLLALLLFVYWFFIKPVAPKIPPVENFFTKIEETNLVEIPQVGVPADLCLPDETELLLPLNGTSKPSEIQNGLANLDNNHCWKYTLDQDYAILDVHSGLKNIIYLQQQNFELKPHYYPVFSSVRDYPGWQYEILQVTPDMRIFISFGGWNYFGNDRPGKLIYELRINPD